MYKVFLIICTIIHFEVFAYTPGVGLDGNRGLGGYGLTTSGPIPSEATGKRIFESQQNFLYKDQNLKQNFELSRDLPVKVLFNRHSYNGFQIQEQQIPALVDQVVRANSENDRPVLVQRQNLGNIHVPYSYFTQQTPQTQVQPPQQQLPPPQQQVPQPPQPLVEQREPLVDQRYQSFDQRPQLPNQRQPELNQIQPYVNIRPLVMGYREPDVEPKQFLDPKPQLLDQRQPELNRRQPVFNINPLVIGQREPNVELKPTDVEQRGFDFIQRQPLNNQQNLIYEQRFPSFSIAEQNPSTVNQRPALGPNQPVINISPLVIEQREPNVKPKQPEVVQREPNLDQNLQFNNQRQLSLQQIYPFLNPQQELANGQTVGQTAVQAQSVVDNQRQLSYQQILPFLNLQQELGNVQTVGQTAVQAQPVVDNQRQLSYQQILPFLNLQQELGNVQTVGQTAVQAQPVADNQRQLSFQQILQQELGNVQTVGQTVGQTAAQAQPVEDQGIKYYVERTSGPIVEQIQPSTNQKPVVFEFVAQNQPYLLSAQNAPIYRDQTTAADQSTDSSGVGKNPNNEWSIETMAPELRNDNWWKSGKMLEERAKLTRRAPF